MKKNRRVCRAARLAVKELTKMLECGDRDGDEQDVSRTIDPQYRIKGTYVISYFAMPFSFWIYVVPMFGHYFAISAIVRNGGGRKAKRFFSFFYNSRFEIYGIMEVADADPLRWTLNIKPNFRE